MKHAGPDALARLEPFLKQVRRRALKEKARGAFYRGRRGFLHFHEHGPELFADLKTGEEFERFPASTAADRKALLARLDALLNT
ncbi:MAG: hypothetical protein JOZ72_10990 [Alphaproteobacteria bacterium]|nr:hypothetical protein [Alphaproteobacteria bacterium]